MKKIIKHVFSLLFFSLVFMEVKAQFMLTGQLRTRTEVRNGFGNLVLKGSKSAVFTSQRTRLIFGYKWDRLTFGASIQDVRVWGQDASSISSADGNKFMLHEGWADVVLFNKADTSIKTKGLDFMSLKIGRQELIYDDQRLIGNLDWLQQARRFDMALLKTMHKGWQIDLGYAFNQNTDAFGVTNTSYVPANVAPYITNSLGILVPTPAGILPMAPSGNAGSKSTKTGTPVWINPPSTNGASQDYKSFTSLYISKKFNQTKFSALFFNDNFGKYRNDSVGSAAAGYVYGKRFASSGVTDSFNYYGTNSRYTYGLTVNHLMGNATGFGKIAIQAAYYAQTGKNRDGIKMNAYMYTVSATYLKGRISITPGYDVLSGNDINTETDEKFDPLYGTPHRHWGYMDYFYAGTSSPSGGLKNPYLRFKYALNAFTAGVDFNLFYLDKNMKQADGTYINKTLGNEIDFVTSYNMNRFTYIEAGYSIMNANSSMAIAKGQAVTAAVANTYKTTGNWFYLMIRLAPDFLYVKPVAAKQ